MMRKLLVRASIALAVVIALGASGYGQDDRNSPKSSFGLHAGFGVDPDQFVVGAQAEFGRFAKVFSFAPSIDVGFGDDVTTYVVNGDLRLDLLPLPKSRAVIYTDAGVAIAHYDFSEADGDTEIGLALAGGVMLPMGRTNSYNIEARFGFGDIPEFRLLVGILFGGANRPSDTVVKENE